MNPRSWFFLLIGFYITFFFFCWIADGSLKRVDQATQEERMIEYYPPETP